MSFEHRKIGEILVDMGALAPAEVRLILDQQGLRVSGSVKWPLPGLLKMRLVAQALAQQFGLEYVDLDTILRRS